VYIYFLAPIRWNRFISENVGPTKNTLTRFQKT
jgi:hypothetical protein